MNTRDSHADMEGQTVNGADTPFISGAGNQLLYPGDPLAPAGEVINCRCYVVSRVKSGSVALTRIRSDYEYKRAKRRSD